MHKVKVNPAAQFSLTVGTRGEISPRRVCRLVERDGSATVYIRRGHTAERLRDAMNEFLRVLLEVDGRWAQTWDRDADRIERPPLGLGIAEIEWRIAPDALLPSGVPCVPLEERGRFIWAIRGGLASPEVIAEMNRYFKRLAGDGLWVQRWPGANPTHN
ncbi:hypothetical protein [Streptomyces fulvorobeus]|uniref:Uncharacterized protein n=1 Tax=Streptomyces fulvorobeus TaxID=284028 RepID=A0A7Y9HA37_9ACTN|nr:hypothetical protein [Streptomyces fulvorobeus]NYE40729.1 hypothetical protein [Streptomyces fulvorobeus]